MQTFGINDFARLCVFVPLWHVPFFSCPTASWRIFKGAPTSIYGYEKGEVYCKVEAFAALRSQPRG